jgi:hypothetical protein
MRWDVAQLAERRSPKPMLMGVQIPPAQLGGTLRGESACTLRTQKWETSVRPDEGRTYSGPAPSRSAAARTGILGMTAKERARLLRDAVVTFRDVQDFARHRDPRTTRR